ncbi:sialidase family protein [Tundrisphaera sp. TA3]|uniref:sialidase family protein n=1 Tax=Tundrisphaera sp. TA3 TaxID=3435775 RepID=UPI003EB6E69E
MRRTMIRWVLLGSGLMAAIAPGARAGGPVGVTAAEGEDKGARQPQVAVDAKGTIYVAFGRDDLVRCAASRDGGKTFATTTVGSAGTLALGMRRGPRVAAAGDGVVVVTAIVGSQGKGKDGDLVAWRSADGGRNWSGPTRVSRVDGAAREGLHGMAAAPDGRVFCTWLDLRSGAMEIYGARSADGGRTWEPDARVYRSPDGAVCTCCHPSAAFGPDGSLAVMWRNNLGGDRDLYYARSADGGRTFAPAEKLGHRAWKHNACPMDGGSIAFDASGRIASAWMRAGSVFTASPGEPERPLGPGVQAWTAAGPSGPVSVWLDRRPGMLLALLPSAPDPVPLAERANDPVVVSGPGGVGPVVAAWESPGGPSGIACQVLEPGPAPAR